VDSRGRTSLAKAGTKLYARYLVTVHDDGTIILKPVIRISPAELEALQAGARAQERERLDHGI